MLLLSLNSSLFPTRLFIVFFAISLLQFPLHAFLFSTGFSLSEFLFLRISPHYSSLSTQVNTQTASTAENAPALENTSAMRDGGLTSPRPLGKLMIFNFCSRGSWPRFCIASHATWFDKSRTRTHYINSNSETICLRFRSMFLDGKSLLIINMLM